MTGGTVRLCILYVFFLILFLFRKRKSIEEIGGIACLTRQIKAGNVLIGGGAPVSIQSMCNTDTRNTHATLNQITALHQAGCELVRLAVPDEEAANAFGVICKASPLPIIADIHFDYRLAILAAKAGAAKIRINPGNIGSREKVRAVADICREMGIPIRIGVNGGSVPPEQLARLGLIEAMVQSAIEQLEALQEFGFTDICLSLKASRVRDTIAAVRMVSQKTDAPLHLGVTEAGTSYHGIIKSAMGIGALLCDGIGDTIRVSLTADPVEEVRAARAILRAAGHYTEGVEIISCPTCGRCRIDVEGLAAQAEIRLQDIKAPLRVAVMGCAVNGPGEAREADCGIAGGNREALLFRQGNPVCKVGEKDALDALCAQAREIAASKDS